MKRFAITVYAALLVGASMTGCKNNPPAPEIGYYGPDTTDRKTVFMEGFEQGTAQWEDYYLFDPYSPAYGKFAATGAAFHTGAKSAAGDSNRTALFHRRCGIGGDSIVGLQFHIMALSSEKANFSVQMGLAELEGMFDIAFGVEFHKSDSIMTILRGIKDSGGTYDYNQMHAPLQPGHWYKCVVEANLSTDSVFYFIDDRLVRAAGPFPELEFINAVLIFRGMNGENGAPGIDGALPYYVDDVHFYARKIPGE